MRIDGLAPIVPKKLHVGKAVRPAKSRPAARVDEFTPSPDSTRKAVLESIKAKVKAGFYNSDEVLDDVSDKLAGLFDRE